MSISGFLLIAVVVVYLVLVVALQVHRRNEANIAAGRNRRRSDSSASDTGMIYGSGDSNSSRDTNHGFWGSDTGGDSGGWGDGGGDGGGGGD
jgi:hypothetical protein